MNQILSTFVKTDDGSHTFYGTYHINLTKKGMLNIWIDSTFVFGKKLEDIIDLRNDQPEIMNAWIIARAKKLDNEKKQSNQSTETPLSIAATD